MNNYLFDKIKFYLKDIEKLEKDNIFNEIEIRFFDIVSNKKSINKNNFEKIFNYLIKNQYEFKNEIIIDKLFNNKFINDFFYDNEYRNKKYMKKYTYNNNYKTLNENFNIFDFNPDKNNTYTSVNYFLKKKQHENNKDFIRINHSIEKNLNDYVDKNIDKYTNLESTQNIFLEARFKNRYIFDLDEYFRLDMTIVKTHSPIYLKNKNNNDIEYIIEIELKHFEKEDLNDEYIKNTLLYKNLKKNIQLITGLYFNKKDFFFNINPMNPQTLSKNELIYLKKEKYSVTDKADGERTFLIFLNDKCYLINPKTKNIIKEMNIDNNNNLHDTIIDGEYLNDKNSFLAFDILFFGSPKKKIYKDMRESNLIERLEILNKTINYIKKINNFKINITMKKFYFDDIYSHSKYIWENKDKLFNYNLDGLIYTPIEQKYNSNLSDIKIPVFKWKEKLSIDVRVEYNFRENFTYFHYNNKIGKPWNYYPKGLDQNLYKNIINKDIKYGRWQTTDKNIINNLNEYNIGYVTSTKTGKDIIYLGFEGYPNEYSNINKINTKYDIVEYEYDLKYNRWIAIRLRTFDKEDPNAYKTIKNIVDVIINYVSIDDLYDIRNLTIENIGALYDITKDNIKRKNWRLFNNYVKNKLYKEASTHIKTNYHLELACGKGGDLFKLVKNGYKNILAIDSSSNELYEKNGYEKRLLQAGYIKEKYYYKNKDIKFTLINGDISRSIKNFECGLNEQENNKLKLFFEDLPNNWKGFDSISIMFAIHYLFGKDNELNAWTKEQKKLEGFMNNIKLLKKGGLLFGTYLNGNNIQNDIMEFIHNGDLMYKIEHIFNKKQNINNYNDIWKQENINTMLIQNEVWGKDIKIPEPKINNNILEVVFDKYNLKSIKINNSFEQYYNDFIKEKNLFLSVNEQKLCFINNIFMYSSFDIDIFINNINELLNYNIYDKEKLLEKLKNEISYDKLSIEKMKNIYKYLYLMNF